MDYRIQHLLDYKLLIISKLLAKLVAGAMVYHSVHMGPVWQCVHKKHVNSDHSRSLRDPASLSLRSGYALPYLTIKHVRQDQA
jgi:hypothetical protein